MRIVSLNAWGGAMFEPLVAWLPTVRADVLCLQEVTRTPGLAGWTHFADGERQLPQRANLFDDVRQLLPVHQAMFMASDAGPVADVEARTHHQDFGIATFVDETLPVIGHRAEFVHGEFTDHPAWIIKDRPRIAHRLRVVDRVGGRTVSVIQLHGLRDPAGKGDSDARHAQARRIAELAAEALSEGDLVVVCGDLNLLPDSATFGVLSEIGLTDLVGTQDTRTSRYTKPIRHASYVLISDPSAVHRLEVPATPEVSDHRPLILDL